MQAICILLGVPEATGTSLWAAVDAGFDIRAGDAGFRTDDASDAADADARVRRGAHRGEARAPDRRHALGRRARDARRRRAAEPHRRRAVLVLLAPVRGRFGDDAQRDRGRAAGADRTTRSARGAACGSALPPGARSRRCCAGRRRHRRSGAPRPRAPSSAVTRSNPATRCCSGKARPTATSSSSSNAMEFDIARDPNPHLALRARRALLPGCEPRSTRDAGDVRGAARRPSRATSSSAPVEWTRSNRHTGIRHLRLTATR